MTATVASFGAAILRAPTHHAAIAADRFEPRYAHMSARLREAGVPLQADRLRDEVQLHLELFIEGQEILVPAKIGIDPAVPRSRSALVHTDDSSGTIEIARRGRFYLGQFFAVWGLPFSKDRLGPYRAQGNDQVRMWVDGEPASTFGELELAGDQHVVVAYGSGSEMPLGVAD